MRVTISRELYNNWKQITRRKFFILTSIVQEESPRVPLRLRARLVDPIGAVNHTKRTRDVTDRGLRRVIEDWLASCGPSAAPHAKKDRALLQQL